MPIDMSAMISRLESETVSVFVCFRYAVPFGITIGMSSCGHASNIKLRQFVCDLDMAYHFGISVKIWF